MFKKIGEHFTNLAIVFWGTMFAMIFVSLTVGSPGMLLARFSFVLFVLLILAYKRHVSGAPSFGHTVAIGSSFIALMIFGGVLDHNPLLVVLGVCTAIIPGWILLNAKYSRIRNIFYPGEWDDDESPRN